MSVGRCARVCEDENAMEVFVELPVEENGNVFLSTLQSMFSDASGLKYRYQVGRASRSYYCKCCHSGWYYLEFCGNSFKGRLTKKSFSQNT